MLTRREADESMSGAYSQINKRQPLFLHESADVSAVKFIRESVARKELSIAGAVNIAFLIHCISLPLLSKAISFFLINLFLTINVQASFPLSVMLHWHPTG